MATNKLSYTGGKPTPGSWQEKLLLFFQNNPGEYLNAPDAAVKFDVTEHQAESFMNLALAAGLLFTCGDSYHADFELVKNLKQEHPLATKPDSFVSQIKLENNIPIPAATPRRAVNEWETLLKSMKVKQSFSIPADKAVPLKKQAALFKQAGTGTYTLRHDKSAGTVRCWRVA